MARINSGGWKSGDLRIWSGELDNIPSGWELAEEMIDRAVVGAGGAYAKGQKFGADSRTPSVYVSVHNHTLSTSSIPAHRHGIVGSRSTATAGELARGDAATYRTTLYSNYEGGSAAHAHGANASSSAVDTRQQSIAVIWIRKL